MPYVIVGVDPGTTSAIAIVDLDGNCLSVCSDKEFSHEQMVAYIAQYGKPILCGADVSPTPEHVNRLARAFGAQVNTLDKTLTKERKQKVTDTHTYIANAHERDALSAALIAHTAVEPLYAKVTDRVSAHPEDISQEQTEEIVATVMQTNCSIQSAIEQQTTVMEDEHATKTQRRHRVSYGDQEKQRTERLQQTVAQQDTQIKHLQEYVSSLKKQVAAQQKRSLQQHTPEISQYKKEIEELRNTLNQKDRHIAMYQNTLQQIENGWLLVKKITTPYELARTNSPIVFVEGLAPKHVSPAIQHIITTTPIADIPTTAPEQLEYRETDAYVLLSPQSVQKVEQHSSQRFSQWLQLYKKRRQTQRDVPYGTAMETTE